MREPRGPRAPPQPSPCSPRGEPSPGRPAARTREGFATARPLQGPARPRRPARVRACFCRGEEAGKAPRLPPALPGHSGAGLSAWPRGSAPGGSARPRGHTYKAVLVRDVVGELELVKGDGLGHPLLAGGRAVGVDVHAFGHLRVGLAGHHPAGVVELVPAVVGRNYIHEQNVLGLLVQAAHPHLERGEHPPAERRTAVQGAAPSRPVRDPRRPRPPARPGSPAPPGPSETTGCVWGGFFSSPRVFPAFGTAGRPCSFSSRSAAPIGAERGGKAPNPLPRNRGQSPRGCPDRALFHCSPLPPPGPAAGPGPTPAAGKVWQGQEKLRAARSRRERRKQMQRGIAGAQLVHRNFIWDRTLKSNNCGGGGGRDSWRGGLNTSKNCPHRNPIDSRPG